MKKEALLVVIESLLEERLHKLVSEIQPIKGERGLRGKPGIDFDFEEHKEKIYNEIQSYIDSIKGDLKLRFSDITDEERELLKVKPEELLPVIENTFCKYKNELKLKFSDLTPDEIDSLKVQGPRGLRGEAGIGFDFEENREEITNIIGKLIEDNRESYKLKFSDLTEEEKELLKVKGPRGQRGREGKGFDFEENKENINYLLTTLWDSKKEDLKLKFSDLSDLDKDALKLSFEHLTDEQKDQLKLKFTDLTSEDIEFLRGPRGPRGQRGKSVKGEDGNLWYRGDGEPTLTAKENDFYLDESTSFIYNFNGESWKKLFKLQGERGPRGVQGIPGIAGIAGRNGVDGLDGVDAPYVIDVSIKKISESTLYFIFYFSDGSKIETNRIDLPKAIQALSIVQNTSVVSSGSSDTAKRLVVTRIADETIAIGKFVTATSGTNIALGQSNVEAKAVVLGMAITAGNVGDEITILLFGNYEETGLTYGLNEPVFLGLNGNGSTTIPLTGWITRVATGNGNDSMFIKVEEPIKI